MFFGHRFSPGLGLTVLRSRHGLCDAPERPARASPPDTQARPPGAGALLSALVDTQTAETVLQGTLFSSLMLQIKLVANSG